MKKLGFAWVMVVSMMAGCGTPAQNRSTAAAAANAEPVAPLPTLQPVRVPAASAKKLVLNMTGPKTSVEAKDWASFKEEWRATFAEHAKTAGIVPQ